MRMLATIRNCRSSFKFVCPNRWDALEVTEDPLVRHCGGCAKDVYFCRTDAKTQEHARSGHCIAREMPAQMAEDADHPDGVFVGMFQSPEELQSDSIVLRELAIDHVLGIDYNSYTRTCPGCHYAVASWLTVCSVCGLRVGRKGSESA